MKKVLLICSLLTLVATNLLSQSSAYDDAVFNICVKYYCMATCRSRNQIAGQELFALAAGPELTARAAIGRLSGSRADSLRKEMEAELENAKQLMTDKENRDLFFESEYGKIMSMVKGIYAPKGAKTEFETYEEFYARAEQLSSSVFDSACTVIMTHKLRSTDIYVTPIKYDIETRRYDLRLELQIYDVNTRSFNGYAILEPAAAKQLASLGDHTLHGRELDSVEWVVNNDNLVSISSFQFSLDNDMIKVSVLCEGYKPLCLEHSKTWSDNVFLKGYCISSKDCNWKNIYQKRLDAIVASWNDRLKSEPYNVDGKTLNLKCSVGEYDYQQDYDIEINRIITGMPEKYADRVKYLKDSLCEYDYERYFEVAKETDTDFEKTIDIWRIDYKCLELTTKDFVLQYNKGIVPSDKTCKERYIYLYDSEAEFDKHFSQAEFMDDINKREKIYTLYVSHCNMINENGTEMKFAGCMKKGGNEYTAFIESSNIKYMTRYYESLIELYMKHDEKMSKEYANVASIFKNKIEFFELYIQPDYKKQLKSLEK